MRILRQPTRLRFVWWLIGIVAFICFAGALFFKDSTFINAFVFVGGLTLIANLIFGAWTAANVTYWETHSEPYELVMITALSDMKLVEGHLFSVLYRLRIPLLFTLSLLPALVIRLTDNLYSNYYWCTRFISQSNQCVLPTSAVVIDSWLVYGVFLLGTIGMTMLAVTLGTLLALWWRNRIDAGFGAVVVIMALGIALISIHSVPLVNNDPAPILVRSIPFTVLMYFMAIAIALMSQRVVRRRT